MSRSPMMISMTMKVMKVMGNFESPSWTVPKGECYSARTPKRGHLVPQPPLFLLFRVLYLLGIIQTWGTLWHQKMKSNQTMHRKLVHLPFPVWQYRMWQLCLFILKLNLKLNVNWLLTKQMNNFMRFIGRFHFLKKIYCINRVHFSYQHQNLPHMKEKGGSFREKSTKCCVLL